MIYEQTMDIVDRLYITEVDAEPEGNIHFPEIDYTEWKLISEDPRQKGERDDHNFNFKIYERK